MGNSKLKIKSCVLIALVIAVCLCAGIGAGTLLYPRVSAAVVEITTSEIPDTACINTAVTLPKNVSVSHNGKTYSATDGVVVSPDGKITAAGELALNQTGEYSVKYFFYEGKVKHTALKKISVYSSYYNFEAGISELELSSAANQLASSKDGAIISLKDGDTFTYSKPVNLKDAGDDGLTNVIEIDGRLGHYDGDKYVSEVGAVWVRLTDCYNPNLYAELRIGRSASYDGAMFTGVGTSYQKCCGLDKGGTHPNTRPVVLDGVQYGFWYNGDGYMNVGLPNMKSNMTTGFVWKYDYDAMRFYLSYNGNDDLLVTDLDEPILYTDGIFFPGWTTGEVFVSIYGENYNSSAARVELISVGRDDVYSLINGEYSDEVAPVITVDAKKTMSDGVYGAVGDTIKIPAATAKDVNLVGGVDVSVYRGYGTDYVSNVTVENGTFVISENEAYSIVYTAKDAAGNVGTSIYKVTAKKGIEKRAIALDVIKPNKFTAGVPVELGYTVKENLNGSVNDVNVKITVQSAHQTAEFNEPVTFIPGYAENYRLTYSYTDGIYSYEKAYTIVGEKKTGVVSFDGDITLPKTFVNGFYYSIPEATAFNYDNGYPAKSEVTAYAVFDGGARTKIDDLSRVKITGNSTVKFIYEADGAETKETETVRIIANPEKSGKIDAAALFTGDFNVDSNSLKFTSKVNSGNNALNFVNAISPRTFNLNYKIVSGNDNFDTLRITLTDYADSSVKMVVDINNGADAAYLSVNGSTATKIDKFNFASESVVLINYSYSGRKLIAGGSNYQVDANFPSGRAYLTIEMLGIHGNSAIEITGINNQAFSSRMLYSDNGQPEIYFEDRQGDFEVGETVKTPVPEFNDVISGVDYSTIGFSIVASDGQPVYGADGKQLTNLDWTKEHEVKLDRITGFYVRYSVKDFAGNEKSTNMYLNCADSSAPVITLTNMEEGGIVHIKAGQEVTLGFTVSDDTTDPLYITTYIHLHCDDMYSYVPNVTGINADNRPDDGVFEEKFNIAIRGNYTAQIHCYDERGNHAVTYVKIVVE